MALKAEMVAKVALLEDTSASLAPENVLLKRRLEGRGGPDRDNQLIRPLAA